jgi:hypothetical protein
MKVCDIDRNLMYTVLRHSLQALEIRPRAIELGVCKGDNAQRLLESLNPEPLVLVDSWSTAANHAYSPFDPLPAWIDPPEAYDFYFGGPTWEQSTWDRLYEGCRQRFATHPEVHIVRASTADALPAVRELAGDSAYDLIYVDASHQYEYVLRDLMLYQDLVGPNGAFMLNDCCHSEAGLRQNLGVLEAVGNFLKRSDFTPVAITNTEWSDVILTRKGSLLEQALHWSLVNSDVAFVDVPAQLFPAARLVRGDQRAHLSFV